MLTTLPARRHATLACYKSLMQANPAVRPRPSTSSSARVLTSSSSRAARSSLGAHRVRLLAPRRALRDHADVCTCLCSQAKIAVQCRSEEDLQLLQASAQSLGLCARSIQDACVHLPFFTRSALTDGSRGARSGRTQVDPGTTTVLGASLSRTVLSSPSPTSYSHFSSLRRYWSCACTRRQPGHQPPQALVTRLPSPSLAIAPHILQPPQLLLARSAHSPLDRAARRSQRRASCPRPLSVRPDMPVRTPPPLRLFLAARPFSLLSPSTRPTMARRQAVPRHDDFLSESDLSPSSGEDDPAEAHAPYSAVRPSAATSGSAPRRPYRDEDDLATGSSDAAAPGARRPAAPPVVGSSEDESSDEDEEKLIGGGKERATTTRKGKKQGRRWEMRSGAGAAATEQSSVRRPLTSLPRLVPS